MAIVAFAATQDLLAIGKTPVYAAPNITDTFTFPNDGETFLHVKKSGAGSCNVTIITPGTVDGNAIADLVVVVPATTGDKMIGPFRPEIYNDPTTGLCSVTFSEVTGLTVGVFRTP